jgi:hypothetical protein
MDNKMEIGVFSLNTAGNLRRVVLGEPGIGSFVGAGDKPGEAR